jgi:hypothetical protein
MKRVYVVLLICSLLIVGGCGFFDPPVDIPDDGLPHPAASPHSRGDPFHNIPPMMCATNAFTVK